MNSAASLRTVVFVFSALWPIDFIVTAEARGWGAQEASQSASSAEQPEDRHEKTDPEAGSSDIEAEIFLNPEFPISGRMFRTPGEKKIQTRLIVDYVSLTDRVVRVRSLSRVTLDPGFPGGLISEFDYGTGVLVGQSGLILTAQHLIRDRSLLPEESQKVAILTRTSPGYLPVEVVAEDPTRDVAVLRATPRFLPKDRTLDADPAKSTRPVVGSTAFVIGIRADAPPDDFEVGVIEGRFVDASSQLVEIGGDKYESDLYVCVSQRIFLGYSGGAVLDGSGRLVGIVVGAPYKGDQWIGFSFGVSIETLENLIEGNP